MLFGRRTKKRPYYGYAEETEDLISEIREVRAEWRALARRLREQKEVEELAKARRRLREAAKNSK